MTEQPEIRVGDADRERIAEMLRQAVGEGRLTLTEYNERVGIAYASTTRGELERVVADLPVAHHRPIPAPAVHRQSDTAPRRRKWLVAVMSAAVRKGRWRADPEITAIAWMGGVEIDLRRAELTAHETVITAVAVMGGVDITVPYGVRVEVGGFSFMGGKDVKVDDDDVPLDAPVIRINGYALMGGIEIKTKGDPKASIEGRS